MNFSRPCGTRSPPPKLPALKRRAIVARRVAAEKGRDAKVFEKWSKQICGAIQKQIGI